MFAIPSRSFLLLFFAVFGLNSSVIYAQQNDAAIWTSFGMEVKVVKKLTASLAQEFRFNENITELGTYFTDAGLGYKINKHLQVAANYRFIQKRRVDDSYSPRHRFYVDVKFQKKFKPFELQFRTRLQDQYADIGRASDGGVAEFYSRNKISLKWNLKKKYEPYLSLELYTPLNYPRLNAFDNMRSGAGVEYAFSSHHNFDLFYMIQKELNVSEPSADFIIGLAYLYKL